MLCLAYRLRLLGTFLTGNIIRKAAVRVDGCCQGIRQAGWRRGDERQGHMCILTLCLR